MNARRVFVAGIILLCACFATAQAVTYKYVDGYYGNDTNDGSSGSPWKTLNKACLWLWGLSDLPTGGVEIRVKAGVYRETAIPRGGTSTKPVKFVGYGTGDKIVCGDDVLSGTWTFWNNYRYYIGSNDDVPQLFVDWIMMTEAREPDTAVGNWCIPNLYTADSGTGQWWLYDSQLPSGSWNNTKVHIFPGANWGGFTKTIYNYAAGYRLGFGDNDWNWSALTPEAGDKYYVFGSVDGLDYPGEYAAIWNGSQYVVYLRCTDNGNPNNKLVTIRKRRYGFNLNALSCVTIDGLKFFACGVKLTGSQSCTVKNCTFNYPDDFRQADDVFSPWGEAGIFMSGSDNVIEYCNIQYSACAGIYDVGTNNTVQDCIISNTNYLGFIDGGCIVGRGSSGAVYRNNTLMVSGRACIDMGGATGYLIQYNDISWGMLLNEDGGLIYSIDTDSNGGRIRYNHIHHAIARSSAGVYLDESQEDTYVYRNLIWSIEGVGTGGWGIMFNTPSLNNWAIHNTVMSSCDAGFVAGSSGGGNITGSLVYDNILQPSYNYYGYGGYVGYNGNYTTYTSGAYFGWPTSTSPSAIDQAYWLNAEVSNPFQGSGPDIGCYESGSSGWTVGPR